MNAMLGTVLRHVRKLADRELPDADLVQRFSSQQDESAFAELMRRHGSLVLAVCRRVLGHEQDAEDAFQATFFVLARKASSIRKGDALASWLHGVAYRVAMKEKANAARRRISEDRAPLPQATDPAYDAAWQDLQRVLDEELNRLPEKYRAPFVLCCMEGKTRPAAAGELGWKEGTVSRRLAHARKVLQERLSKRGVTLWAALIAAGLAESAATAKLPPLLAAASVKAALAFSSSPAAAAGLASGKAVLLAKATLQSMALAPLKLGVALLATACLLATGAGLLRQAPAKQTQTPRKSRNDERPAPLPQQPETKQVRTDRYGDPLPEGAVARLGTVRMRPGSGVYFVAFLPGDQHFVSAAAEEGAWFISTWETATGKLSRRFQSDPRYYWRGLTLSPDGKTLAGSVLVMEQQRRHTLVLWDLATGKEIPLPAGMGARAYSLAYTPDNRGLVTGGDDKLLRLWDLATGAEKVRFQGTENIWMKLAVSPDGKTLLGGAGDGAVVLWDMSSGRVLRTLSAPVSKNAYPIAFSADGKLVAAAWTQEDKIRVWETATGREVWRVSAGGQLNSLIFSPDGKSLLSGEGKYDRANVFRPVRVWDVATGRETRQFPGQRGQVWALALSRDGKQLLSAGARTMRLWDFASGKEVLPLPEQEPQVMSVAFSPDGRRLATAGSDGALGLWDPATGDSLRRLEGGPFYFRVACAPTGRTVAAAAEDGVVRLWDAAKGGEARRLEGHKDGPVIHVDFSPDGRVLATGGHDRTVRLWDTATGKELRRFPGVRGVFSADGKVLATMGIVKREHEEYEAVVWEAATGKELRRLPSPVPAAVCFSPDGRTLAGLEISASSGPFARSRTIRLWDLVAGTERTISAPAEITTTTLAYSPDGRTLAWGEESGAITLWEVAAARIRRKLTGHQSRIQDLSFSPDGRLLASACSDTTALMWDISDQRQAGPLPKTALRATDLEDLWTALAGADAARAEHAIWTLAAEPGAAISFLERRLKPVRKDIPPTIADLIQDLDSRSFDVREKATADLAALGADAEPGLRRALDGKPALERRRRIERLLEKLEHSPERWRLLRALEVLEHIGTAEVETLLKTLAKGAPEGRVTQEAQAVSARFVRRHREVR